MMFTQLGSRWMLSVTKMKRNKYVVSISLYMRQIEVDEQNRRKEERKGREKV